MCDENIEIGVTEITNNILVSAQPTDQIIDINVLEEVENVELTITPSVVEVNIDVTQELITEVVTVDANTCVNIVDVTVTDATDNVTLNITPSLVEVNINRGENNLSIEEYESFADLPTIGDTDTYYITLDDNKFWRWDAIDEVYVEISDSNDKIPYLGAYKNSDLGEWGIKSNWFGLDTTPTNPPNVAGTFTWNDTEGTADLILKGGNVTLQLGQEEVLRVVNKTGATLNEADFRAVRIRSVAEGGAQGQRLAVVLAQGDNDPDSATTIGLVTETIANNQEGFITTGGNVNKINTTGAKSFGAAETWVDGDVLYLSPTHAGYLTNVKPQAPNHTVIIGWVVYAHANNGKIFVKVDNGYELDELHNVKINSPINKDALIYNSSLGVWENKPLSGLLTATSPLSITSNVISISQANATTDGYVSSADWNYFSAKQQPLFGTGFVKATGSVISYDNTVYTPQSRTLTINGTSYDLSADRSWSISVGSGMRNVSSFVATSGQTTFTIVGGYTAGLVDVFVNGVRLNGGDYTATNGTTVVLSVGAIANDLVDIINYTASLTSGVTGSGTTNYIPLWSGSSNLTNSLISQSGTTITANGVFKANGVIASIDGGLYAGSGYQLVFADYGSSEFASIEGSSFSGASSYLRFITNANERMRITSSGLVGINTSSPRARLDVVGNIYSRDIWIEDNYNLLFGNLTTGASSTYIYGVGGDGVTNYLGFATNGSEKVRILANGNVGIGTATPSEKLSVIGNIRIDNGAADGGQLVLASSGFSDWNIDNLSGSLRAYYNATEYFRFTNTGNLLIGTTSATAFNRSLVINSVSSTAGILFQLNGVDKGFIYSGGGDLYIGSNSNTLQLYTNGSERFRITSGGSVGIGVTSPSAQLEVRHSSGTGLNISNTTANSYAELRFQSATSSGYIFKGSSGFSAYGGPDSLNIYNEGVIAFYNTTERMRITSGGNVGIGTTSPSTKLHIVGTGASGGSLKIQTTGGVDAYLSLVDNTREFLLGSSGGNFYLYDATSAANRIVINSSGNIGIGSTSPSRRLDVASDGSNWISGTFSGTGGTDKVVIGNLAMPTIGGHNSALNAWSNFTIAGVNIMFSPYGSEAMRITDGALVGIGTTAPATKLHINTSGDTVIRLTSTAGAYSSGIQMFAAGAGAGFIYSNQSVYVTANANGVYLPTNGTSWVANSDLNLKNIESYIENAIESIMDLKAIRFNWKADVEKSTNIGLIAQEVEKVYPELINKNREGYLGVRYTELIPVIIKAIQELNEKLEAK